METSPLDALRRAVEPGQGLLLAVSGGADSMALFHVACTLRAELELRIEVAHLDHGLRESSAGDADFVRDQTAHWDCPVHVRRLEPPAAGNIEAWGRRERYRFFEQVRSERNLDAVLTAHTSSDCAETLLMRLLSNKEVRAILAKDPSRKLVRPFLEISRQQILHYCDTHGVPYRVDPSNTDPRFLRNKIRRMLMPYLTEHFHPQASGILAQRAAALAEDIAALDTLVERSLSDVSDLKFGSREWQRRIRSVLGALPEELHWRVASELLFPVLHFRLGREKSREVLLVFRGERNGAELPGGSSVRRVKGEVRYIGAPMGSVKRRS